MKTFDEWVSISNETHQNKYTYKEIYKHDTNKYYYFKIICKTHGEFDKRISNHVNNRQGCPKCALEKSSKIQANTTDYFINNAKLIHGNKYDYSLVDYKCNKTKVKIIFIIPF